MKNNGKRMLNLLLALTLVIGMLALGGCKKQGASGGTQPGPSELANTDPIKIGFLIPKSGGYAPMGALFQAAIDIALEEYGTTVGGREVQFVIEDTQSDPSYAVQMAQKLIEQAGCSIILGPASGSCALAVKEYAAEVPGVTFIQNGGSEDQTMRTVYENVYRCSITGAQSCWGLGEFAVNDLGFKRFVTIAPDNDFQYSQIAGFVTTVTLAGGEVVERMWFPEVGNDFSSLIAQIPSDVDAIFLAAGGSNGADFLKQYNEYGMTIPVLGGHSVIDELTIHTPEIGAVIEGSYGATTVAHDIDTDAFRAFNEKHIERVGYPASIMTVEPYISMKVTLEAIAAVDGKVEDIGAFRSALSATDIETPIGHFSFDGNRQGVFTTYVVQVTKDGDGGYYNRKLGQFDNQTQFGPFTAEWYESQPSPNRDNPTIDAIKTAEFVK